MKRLVKENYQDLSNLINEYPKEEFKIVNIKLNYYDFDELNLTEEEITNAKNVFPLIKGEKVGVYILVDNFDDILSVEQLSHRFNKNEEDIEKYLVDTNNAKDFDMEDSIYFVNEKDIENALEWLKN